MKKYRMIYWTVDNSSGTTMLNYSMSKKDCLDYFELNFGRFGYKLVKIV